MPERSMPPSTVSEMSAEDSLITLGIATSASFWITGRTRSRFAVELSMDGGYIHTITIRILPPLKPHTRDLRGHFCPV
jgi:hypothetical protein